MDSRNRSLGAKGFSLLEVLVALVLLGLISGIYMYTSHASQKNTGKSVNWQAESVAIEKAVELLRSGHTLGQVQHFDSSWIDNTSRMNIDVTAIGDFPPDSVCQKYGVDQKKLAQVTITAKRTTASEGLTITTYLWLN
jgi:prepilin-type N-terminal cleavage/methylation domain-containing protein